MKQKIRIVDKTGKKEKVIEREYNVPAKDHLAAQIKFRAHVFKPKKGKGSFKRNKRDIPDDDE